METRAPHILVVDDELMNREIIQEILEDQGYTISMAEDGSTVLKMLSAEPEKYDVILLDRMMPGIDGMRVLKEIRNDPVLKHCPVILQTARAAKDEIVEGIKAGAYYYLAKPFDDDMLLSIVSSAVEERLSFLSLREKLSHCKQTLNYMENASFRVQNLDEAHDLAFMLASACPEPDKVINGLSEMLINAIEHGNLGISYDEKSQLLASGAWAEEIERRIVLDENINKFAQINFQRAAETIEISITDEGEGFDWGKYIFFDPDRATDNHGRGIAMANCMSFSKIEYIGKGNSVKLYIT